MSADLEQLRREHAERVIGPQLMALLERIVRATAPAYPAAEYSDSGTWDSEALADALQEWVEVRLLKRGDLSKLLTRATSMPALRGALTRSFKQFLTNRRRRTSATNLYQRTTKMLRAETEHFAKVGQARRSHEQLWTLRELAEDGLARSRLSIPALVAIACELDDDELEVIRYEETRLKSSPILREPKLRAFVIHLLGEAEGALDQSTIAEVMRRRFGLFELVEVSLEEEGLAAPAPEPRSVEQGDLVASALARLGKARCEELREFYSSPTDPEVLPEAVNVAITLVAEYARSAEEAEAAYDQLIESLLIT